MADPPSVVALVAVAVARRRRRSGFACLSVRGSRLPPTTS